MEVGAIGIVDRTPGTLPKLPPLEPPSRRREWAKVGAKRQP